jgi:hypothetical protein
MLAEWKDTLGCGAKQGLHSRYSSPAQHYKITVLCEEKMINVLVGGILGLILLYVVDKLGCLDWFKNWCSSWFRKHE